MIGIWNFKDSLRRRRLEGTCNKNKASGKSKKGWCNWSKENNKLRDFEEKREKWLDKKEEEKKEEEER